MAMGRYLDVTHIAVEVDCDLREAEQFYCDLFDLTVAWREPVPDDAPFDLPWEDLLAAGVQPEITMLHDGAFRLTVVSTPGRPARAGVIGHVGLQISVDQLRLVRTRSREMGFTVVADREGELFDFVDRFGMEWELDTRSFAEPVAIVEQKRQRSRL